MSLNIDSMLNSVLTAQLDPDAAVKKDLINSLVTERRTNLPVLKSDAIEKIEARLTAAIARNADSSVIDGYQKCIAELVAG